MKHVFSIIAILLLTVSCQEVERMEKPRDLIPKEKMVDVLTELSLMNAARNYNKYVLEQKGVKLEEHLWKKFDIDSLQFVRSSNYYAENYKEYNDIYMDVKDSLEVLKVYYDSINKENQLKKDSIPTQNVESRDSIEGPPRKLRLPQGDTRNLPPLNRDRPVELKKEINP